MSDSNFTQILNIVADTSGITRNVLGDELWFTSHCFRREGAQYRFMFAPEKQRWSLKLVKWCSGWAPSEKAETVTRYLLDDVLDREESQLGDLLAPDATIPTNTSLKDLQDFEFGSPEDVTSTDTTKEAPVQDVTSMSASIVRDLKSGLVEELRGIIKDICTSQSLQYTPSGEGTTMDDGTATETAREPEDDSRLMSELPDAKAWRDYVFSTGMLIRHVTNTEQASTCSRTSVRCTARGYLG
ncbi:hypothetical protein V7S43_015592 [Phytophthora oleae]|uniref:Uncharacterized protein n=1 Tax=Phytophthora oleae TaxID=2107226 RepID=A0ABD3F128_9STRA